MPTGEFNKQKDRVVPYGIYLFKVNNGNTRTISEQ